MRIAPFVPFVGAVVLAGSMACGSSTRPAPARTAGPVTPVTPVTVETPVIAAPVAVSARADAAPPAIYVLTAARTFSGPEAFAYDLQTTKRATIIGEVTGGGARPTGPVPLDEHFVLMVPSSRPINAVTKKDWEGTRVKPDVKVPADQALDKAKQLAVAKLARLHAARK